APEPSADAGRTAEAGAIRLSELMVKNGAALRDEDGDFSDWIELENRSDRPVELAGWRLSDKKSADKGWTFPAVTLEPGERLLVFASGKDRRGEALHTDFALSAGEWLTLGTPDGEEVFSLQIPESDRDCSLIPGEDGALRVSVWPTPGLPNDAEGYRAWQESRAAEGALVISEVMTANLRGVRGIEEGLDWVELKNVSGKSLELSDYYLSDDRNDYRLWQLPQGTLKPGDYCLVVCDRDAKSGYPQAPFSLDSGREELFLSSKDGLSDCVSLHDLPVGGSCGRLDGENGFFYFTDPTPGRANGEGFRRISDAPAVSLPGGVFENTGELTVGLTGPGAIYYTLDGSLPTADSARYEEPLLLTKTTVLRAVCVEDGALPSRAATESYFLNEGHELPVLSLVSDSARDFRNIYNGGLKHLEIPGCISLYEKDGGFTIGCGITMSGQSSLKLPKKNVSVRFRGAYGESTLHYDVFDGGVDEFESLTIRSGQDYYYAVIRDELCQNLALAVSPDHLVTQRSKYCVLYVNGEYFGIYALKEKITRQFYASWAGVGKDSVTVENGPVLAGSVFGGEVVDFVLWNDMSDPDNYARFCELADVDSFIDWAILEGYCANPDILSGNVRYARSTEGDGKYRVVFFDLDAGMRQRHLTFDNVIGRTGYAPTQQISQVLFELLENDDFRARFLERFSAAIHGPLSDESVLAEIDRLYGQIESELPRDLERWDRSRTSFDFEFGYLVGFISDDYARGAIESVCRLLEVTDAERTRYFPETLP
nr:CotH kinase family protein [Oscillospiraceae bacterium]